MRRDRWTSIACLILLTAGAAGPARAQQATSDRGGRADLDEIRKVSALRKADVLNQANEKIASVSDLMISPDGKIHHAILSVGGLVGIGAKYTAIPWDRLDARHVNGKWAVNLPMTKEVLEKAPMIESDNYRELADPQWTARAREFFATQAGPGAARDKEPPAGADGNPTVLMRASKVLGANLRNARDESLGSVEDLLLGRNARVAFAIIGHGGVLGVGENHIPVPWSKLQLNQQPNDAGLVAVVNASKDQMEKAPLVKGDSYETMLAPGFTDQVHRYFGAEKP